jgi:hypothetical protein
MTDEPDYRGFRIKDIHAIVAIGDDDEEGIPAIYTPDGPAPLIAADPRRLKQIIEMGQAIANDMGKNFKVVRFSVREDIGEIKSKKVN